MTKMRIWRVSHLLAAAILTCSLASAQENTDTEAELIAVLKSDAPKAEKAITCKYLAVYGTKNAVPELAKLLPDEQLMSWARTALEAIPDPAADDALRAALETVEGRTLIGVINSIAVRRDAKAVEGLVQHLETDNVQVASAAAVALGHIGDESAREALQSSLAVSSDALRSAVAEGCILAAERLHEAGQSEQAANLYDLVRSADVPAQRVREAIRGVIVSRNSIPLLTEQLKSSDKERFGLGLRTARELDSADVTAALIAALDDSTPQRQGFIVLSLAERDGANVLPAILQAAGGGSKSVRRSAMQVLGRIGDASCLPTLLEAATGSDAEVAEAAADALASLPDESVNKIVASRLGTAKGATRRVLIDVVGSRRIAATPELVKAADDSNKDIRSAALAALGATVEPDELPLLITRVTDPQHSRDSEAAQKALRAACVRMPDREACAEQLAAAMPDSPISAQQALVSILAEVGGKKALETVGKAAADRRTELKDIASQSLGKWMTPDAASVLLKLAQPQADEKYRIRALRGYIRIARQMKITAAERANICEQALKVAARDAERELVLKVLEIHPSVDALLVAIDAEKTSSIKEKATRTAQAISQKIGSDSDELRKLLASGRLKPAKIEIVSAMYGVDGKSKDVTATLKKSVGRAPIVSLPSRSYNASFGGDPAPGLVKQLVVEYRINGVNAKASFTENALIVLPLPDGVR